MNKTLAAYWLTCREIFQSPNVYFWTFTFIAKQPVWIATRSWVDAQRALFQLGCRFRGVKVAEMHRAHGLHFHLLIDRRLPVALIRRVFSRYGFGRIEVEKVRNKEAAARYLVKYLRPGQEPLPVRGMRRWSRIGGIGEKVSDMVCMSEVAIATRSACKEREEVLGRKLTRDERFRVCKEVRADHDAKLFVRDYPVGQVEVGGKTITLRNPSPYSSAATFVKAAAARHAREYVPEYTFIPSDDYAGPCPILPGVSVRVVANERR